MSEVTNRMALSHNLIFVVSIQTLILLGGLVKGSSRFRPCENGFFFETSTGRCKRCSECPANRVIHTPCSNVSDVKCESLSFKSFQSSNAGKNSFNSHQFTDIDENSLEDGIIPRQGDDSLLEKANKESNQGPATVEKGDREYWKKLALALIGALSILIVVATIIVIIAWVKVQKASTVKLPEEGDMDDADSGYVVIRSIRHMAFPRSNAPAGGSYSQDGDDTHPPLLQSQSTNESSRSTSSSLHHQQPSSSSLCYLPKVYKPQRRLLNYDADDVFESDDNSLYNTTLKSNTSFAHTQIRSGPQR